MLSLAALVVTAKWQANHSTELSGSVHCKFGFKFISSSPHSASLPFFLVSSSVLTCMWALVASFLFAGASVHNAIVVGLEACLFQPDMLL